MKIVIIGSGMMGSAMAVPALDNGHTVTLVGTPLDTEIIDGLKESNYHSIYHFFYRLHVSRFPWLEEQQYLFQYLSR